jgi:hypothetical protein
MKRFPFFFFYAGFFLGCWDCYFSHDAIPLSGQFVFFIAMMLQALLPRDEVCFVAALLFSYWLVDRVMQMMVV